MKFLILHIVAIIFLTWSVKAQEAGSEESSPQNRMDSEVPPSSSMPSDGSQSDIDRLVDGASSPGTGGVSPDFQSGACRDALDH